MALAEVVKRGEHSAALDDAFGRLFATMDDLIRQGPRAGKLQPGDPNRVRLLLFAAILVAADADKGPVLGRVLGNVGESGLLPPGLTGS